MAAVIGSLAELFRPIVRNTHGTTCEHACKYAYTKDDVTIRVGHLLDVTSNMPSGRCAESNTHLSPQDLIKSMNQSFSSADPCSYRELTLQLHGPLHNHIPVLLALPLGLCQRLFGH